MEIIKGFVKEYRRETSGARTTYSKNESETEFEFIHRFKIDNKNFEFKGDYAIDNDDEVVISYNSNYNGFYNVENIINTTKKYDNLMSIRGFFSFFFFLLTQVGLFQVGLFIVYDFKMPKSISIFICICYAIYFIFFVIKGRKKEKEIFNKMRNLANS